MVKLGCSQAKEIGSADLSVNQTQQDNTGVISLSRNNSAKTTVSSNKNSTDINNNNMLNPNNLGLPKPSELGRKKMVLGKGYSLMDWIRYSKTTPNIAGNNGVIRPIPYDELAKHNTEDDCWMAIHDKVYNVTPYMKYHPGGIDELMKGAGLNATEIFNDVHPWVNYHSMLERCFIGKLVGKPKEETKSESTQSSASLKVIDLKSDNLKLAVPESDMPTLPAFDLYHTLDTINIVIYTKWKEMKSEYVIVDQISSNKVFNNLSLVLFVYIKNDVFKLATDNNLSVKNEYKVNVGKDGKVEIILLKIDKNLTMNINKNIFTCETVPNTQSGVGYRVCELIKKTRVTHDTDIYVFDLPETTRMCVPLGYHIFLKFFNSPDDYPVKPYTVINSSFFDQDQMQINGKRVYLMIKHYFSEGYFTSKLRNIKIGSKIQISNFTGDFKMERLLDCDELVLICAGSGFTPMISLLIEAVKIDTIKSIHLLFFNKRLRDILWHDEIKQLEEKYPDKLNVTYCLSKPDTDWQGKSGRINIDLLKECVVEKINKPLFAVCGPKAFTDFTIKLIKESGFQASTIHPFLG